MRPITLNCAFILDSVLIHPLTLKCHHAENAVSGSQAARRVLALPASTLSSSSSPFPGYKLAAQRVERCLSILERFAEQCQV